MFLQKTVRSKMFTKAGIEMTDSLKEQNTAIITGKNICKIDIICYGMRKFVEFLRLKYQIFDDWHQLKSIDI